MALTIRAHHLESAKALYRLSREVIVAGLIKHNYIDSETHPFVDLVEGFKALFEGPQKFRLKIGGLDIICVNCPKHQRKDCNPNKPRKKVVEKAFLMGNYESPLSDIETIEKYGLDLKTTYTTTELREIADF